jgi:hypothetical protein
MVIRFDCRYPDADALRGLIIEGGMIHENVLLMREALGRHFKMSDLQDQSLSDLCRLYVDLVKQGDA